MTTDIASLPSDKATGDAHPSEFNCIIPHPKGVMTAERLKGSAFFPPATCRATGIVAHDRFALRCKDSRGNSVDVVAVPRASVMRVTYRSVSRQAASRTQIIRSMRNGAAAGFVCIALMFFKLGQQGKLAERVGMFILAALGVLALFTLGGGVVGAAMTAVHARGTDARAECAVATSGQGVSARFSVSPDQLEDVLNAFRSMGIEVQEESASVSSK